MKKLFTAFGCLLVLFSGAALAQKNETIIQDTRRVNKIALGRSLFRSPHLSGNKKMTCATCHEPDLSFTDGAKESDGILGSGVGRNSPTMMAIAHIKHFPGPKVTSRNPLKPGRALTLEERCLVPIENPLEMASSVEDAVARLKKSPGMLTSFKKAYGPGIHSVTPERIGDSLAHYLRSLKAPKSPYREFKNGKTSALSEIEKRGLKLFNTTGKCAECHKGEALSDGLLHMAFMPGSPRDRAQTARAQQLARVARQRKSNLGLQLPTTGIGRELFERLAPPVQQGCPPNMNQVSQRRTTYDGQDPFFRQMHTLSLWDVARTAPYFRDGSSNTLEDAVQKHISELRAVSSNWGKVRSLKRAAARRTRVKTDPKLLPKWMRSTGRAPLPEDLTAGDMKALVAFLKTLSPRD